MMKQNKTNSKIINKAIYSIKLFLILCLFCWPVQSYAQLENLDIEVIDNDYVLLEVEHECPAILNIAIISWENTANYCKWFHVYMSIDGGPEFLIYEHRNSHNPNVVGQWWTTTPNSTLLQYGPWNGFHPSWLYHDAYVQIPSGKNVTFRTEGMMYRNGTEEPGNLNNTGSYEFPAPGAPDGFSLSQSCSANTLTWSVPSAMPSCAGTLVYDIYRRASGAGSYTYLTATSSTSYTDNAPTGDDSYRVRAKYTPQVPFSFTMPDGYEPNLGGANTTTRWPSYSVYTNALDAKALTPPTPTGLTATTDKCSEIKLDWSIDGSPDAVKIYRNGTEIGEVGGMFRTFTDEPANPQTGASYTYHLRAYNQGCAGSNSTSTVGRTFGDPTAPGNFAASAGTNAVTLTWTDAVNESRYIIKRSSASGATEFEVSANATSYTDNSVNGCEQYTYQIYAGNKCTEQGSSGIKAVNEPTAKLIPDLSAYLLSADASKAYFPDKIKVEWKVFDDNINMVNSFDVSRSLAGENDFELLGSVQGASSYEDITAVGGMMYEYRVTGKLDCEGNLVSSNSITTTGFRLPYGIVNGHIEYESGVAVQGVEVLAEKASGSAVGSSLLFDGSGSATVANHSQLNPSANILAEAWIKPATLAGTGNIISKQSGAQGYRLYQNNSDVVFELNIGGVMRTVTAPDALETGKFSHVAGSFDATGIKIYIDGKIPTITSYILTADGISELEGIGIEPDIIASLSSIQDVEYALFDDFQSALNALLGEPQQQRNMPLIIPVAKKVEYVPGTKTDITGALQHSATDLVIGTGFQGNIDEIRIWNSAKNEAAVLFDYKRIVGNDATGIAGYWRCDENFGSVAYDVAKSNGLFHKNNAVFAGGVSFDSAIPGSNQLGWIGVTNASGDYTIPYVPYYGTGENFTLTPRYETHEFKPGSSTIFLGEGAAISNGQDFTDISSFKVTGTVFYENTTCGVEGVIITVDGNPVIKDGAVIMTDQAGEFEVEVPVGNHYVSVQKNNHLFKSYKFPPGPTSSVYNFQEDVVGINFIDTTTVTVVGRVVGGTREGNKIPGLGFSVNNIGLAKFDFVSVTGPACSQYHVSTDPVTGEYSVQVPPMKYNIRNFEVPKNPIVTNYFSEFEVADFSIVAPVQTVSHTFEGAVDATIVLDTVNLIASLDIQGYDDIVEETLTLLNSGTPFFKGRFIFNGEIYEYPLNADSTITVVNDQLLGNGNTVSCSYNYRLDYIYRSAPEIKVTASDGASPVSGDRVIRYEDRISHTKRELNIEQNPFQYPVFTQGNNYEVLVTLDEVYVNQDMCAGINGCDEAVEDRVPVNDGVLQIFNQLAKTQVPPPVSISNGKATYQFQAGSPVMLSDANYPWRNYSGVLNITAVLGGNGYTWEPYNTGTPEDMPFQYDDPAFPHGDDKYFRGYVLGSKPVNGSDFVTNGPAVVEMILRDPPGSESSSFLEKGTTFTNTQSISIGAGLDVTNETTIGLGTEFAVGLGFSTETEITNDLKVGVSVSTSINLEGEYEKAVTLNEAWRTSESPELAGAPSDIFFGSSNNYIISLADNLTIFNKEFADSNNVAYGGNPAGPDGGQQFVIGQNKSLMAAPDGFPTYFIYTADHIENYLIPNLVNLRNNLFIIESDKYVSNISAAHELYGSNNDDPRWPDFGEEVTSDNYITTSVADYNGASYTFIPDPNDEKDKDMIRNYNEQIRLWTEALERNEMEKYNAGLIRNISFDAGPTFEYSVATEITETYTTTFELEMGASIGWEIGGDIGGVGLSNELGMEIKLTTGQTNASSEARSNTFGYTLHDPDQGDYLSVDVKDPGTGTGPVFAIKGGRTMCPYEDAVELKYYTPGKHLINDQVLAELTALGVNADLIKVLSSDNRGNFSVDVLNIDLDLGLATDLLNIIGEVLFNLPQIKDRQFNKTYELREAVYDYINLNIDITGEDGNEIDLLDHIGDVAGLLERLGGGDGELKFYLFPQEFRDAVSSEFERYRSYIYDLSRNPDRSVNLLSEATIRREIPVASISPAVVYNVPDDNKAYFTIQFGNESASGETMVYEARILEQSNPDGAVITIDGGDVNRTFEIEAGSFINKTLAVEMGKDDVYIYENLQIVLYSPCEYALGTLSEESIDTVTFSVHFVPSCTNIDIMMPDDMFIINSSDEALVDGVKKTKVPVVLSGYDMNNEIFEKLTFQYKYSAEAEWTNTTPFYVNPGTGEEKIPGAFTGLEWDLSGFPDGQYMIRAKTYCGRTPDNTEIFDLSEVWEGSVDRKAPQVFGSPQPADGILSPGDDIMVEFNETIFGAKMTKIENFDIRGILNGTTIRHDVSVRFDDDPSQFIRIPSGINVSGKSFTVEFWMKPARSNYDECLFAQNSDPDNAIYIGLNAIGNLEMQVGATRVEFTGYSASDYMGAWGHYTFIYDDVRKEASLLVNGLPLSVTPLDANYNGFGDIYIGKSMFGTDNTFKGNIHELRIWERPRTAGKIYENMLVTLSGKETALLGYWPLDDAHGTLAADKVHKRNATVAGMWEILPAGYAGSFDGSGLIDVPFSDVAFTNEEDFSLEMWFKGNDGANKCFISNGHGDDNDLTLYYISPEGLYNLVRVMPLEDSIDLLLTPIINEIFSDTTLFFASVDTCIGVERTAKYKEQLLRFSKIPPTYWCLNTDANGYLQLSNNGKRISVQENFFDNTWHHLAVVVQRVGNTRIFVDGDLKISAPSTEWSGFGGARLFIGARGKYDISSAGFTFDQYFNGQLDEVRIWSTVLKQSQIQRNNKMRLDGDELGLVAYWPFETYEEVMGVPIIGGTFNDIITERDKTIGTSLFTQNTEVPNVRMKRPSSKVDFDFVYKEDQISFVINEPPAKIENCILDITVQNVQDMYGNRMNSPVTWSAYIDMNQVKWDKQQLDFEKEMYAPMSFTAKIINSSGLQQNFSIENLPGWLSASPREGTMKPLTEQTITFTVSEGTNVGSYSQNIHLQTDFDFDEKLMVNLRVIQPLPNDWNINPAQFANSMSVIGQVKVNGVISTDSYDKVAAFVDGKCRGIGSLQYIAEYDVYEVFLDIYSNKSNGEYYELHIWDASEGREYRGVSADGLPVSSQITYSGLYEFIDNTVYGSPSVPIILEATGQIIRKIPLTAGWNWRSFNLQTDKGKSLSEQLYSLTPQDGDVVKGMARYATYAGFWAGTLNSFNPDEMYMFKCAENDTLYISGLSVDPATTPINIVEGWNWIGYTPLVNIGINDALGLFSPAHGDLIKSQYAFSMYDERMGWVGSLKFLQPNMGYKYKYVPGTGDSTQQQLFYPETGSELKSARRGNNPAALHSYAQYPSNMSVIANISAPGIDLPQGSINVFSDNSQQGSTTPISLTDGKQYYFITTFGNEAGQTLRFEFTDNENNTFLLNETIDYYPNLIIGTVDLPFELTFNNEDYMHLQNILKGNELSVYPNPFNDKLNVRYNEAEGNAEVAITDILGKTVYESLQLFDRGKCTIAHIANLKPGTYFISVRYKDQTIIRKILKK